MGCFDWFDLPEYFRHQIGLRIPLTISSVTLLQSYEMSPCKDSDEEDNDDLEHQEELRRRRKFIPSWSRLVF